MNYFVGFNLGSTITGIEKALINRLYLFKKADLPAKCVFIKWNRYLSKQHNDFIDREDFINMYDYFQEIDDVTESYHFDWITYWESECHFNIEYIPNTNDIRVYDGKTFIMYAHFLNRSYKHIDYINYFDKNRRKVKRELFDIRVFLSCTKILTGRQETVYESYHNENGEILIEKYYHTVSGESQLDLIVLNHHQKHYFFNSEEELVAYFIEDLYQEGDLFFSDKNRNTAPAFNLTDSKIPVVAVLHNTHVKNANEIETSNYKNVYKHVFNNLPRYKAILASTVDQKEDVAKRINNEIPVVNIPVGYTKNTTLASKQVEPKKLIAVARYSPEKQLDHQIRLIEKLKDDYPQIELHMFGFGIETDKLKIMIKDKHLENHVFLRGFLPSLDEEYNNAYLCLITSYMEGFNLALLECLAHGIPAVSYDMKYGPAEMINNEENGYLIQKDDENALYEKVKYLLDHPELQHEFSINSVKVADQFSDDNLIDQWKSFLKTL